jgi:hypothetical protein
MMSISEFTLPPSRHDQGWFNLREGLTRAAREVHFSAVSPGTNQGSALLMLAGNLAALAMSIPAQSAQNQAPGMTSPLIRASTSVAAQALGHGLDPYEIGGEEASPRSKT